MVQHSIEQPLATTSGVFEHLVDSAAFVDRIVLSVGQPHFQQAVQLIRNRMLRRETESLAIGGKNSLYARLLRGRCKYSGNPIGLKYGKRKTYARVPALRLAMRSDRVPLTCAEVLFTARGLYPLRVSLVEMTFDLRGVSIHLLSRQLFTRAQIRDFGSTMYVGAALSGWQARIYKKTDSIVRFEFIFRRAFLRKHRISRPHELIKLRTLNICELVCFRKRQKNAFLDVLASLSDVNSEKKDILCRLSCSHPQLLERVLRTQYRIPTLNLFSPSDSQILLRRMQRQFVW